MRFRALLLAFILAAIGIPVSAVAQNNPSKPVPDATPAETSPAATAPSKSGSEPAEAHPASEEQSPAKDAEGAAKNPDVNHHGGKNDVDSIGSRKVGGFDIYPIDTDIKIGRTYAAQIERSMKIVQDAVINEYVNRIGQNLVRNSDAKFPLTIKVVEDDAINAMALPGGFLYVNTGLVLGADDEAELAGAMAHEIAHIALRHATRQMTRAQLLNLATAPVIFVGGLPGVIGPQVARLALPATLLQFSRNFEAEADYFGVEYMYKAGYDPNALVNFFEKIQALEKRKPGTLSQAFSTHPPTPERMRRTEKEIAKILPARERYVETTSEFNDVRGRLAVLERRQNAEDGNAPRPALRRTSDDTSPQTKKDDDRPVLNRRNQ
ncbi:MAG TPA: M48 family metallopeptidase [Candidatus Angelobacter sp.]|nr:M48 family metallopeptidase [Candidatus Angelobacter sp.]